MTTREMITAYGITLMDDGRIRIAYPPDGDAAREAIKAAKPEIVAEIKAAQDAEKQAAAERAEMMRINVVGLKVLESAYDEHESYHEAFNRAMENGNGRLPALPKSDIAALSAEYPRAAAYIKAKNWHYAHHDAKASAGARAEERIIAGEDIITVMADMETEWSSYCEAHIWD